MKTLNRFKMLMLCLMLANAAGIVHAHPSFEDAWIRLLPPNMTMTSAYAVINSGHADRIVAATTDIAERVEIHETTSENGMMNMRQIDALELVQGEATVLKPGGHHLMIIGLKRALKEGETIPITFELEQSPALTVEFVVKKP